MPSSKSPPNTAPNRIEVWIAATIRLPAASGASSTFCDIQVIQITEVAVFITPQIARIAAVAISDGPTANRASVQAPMTNAGSRSSGATPCPTIRPAAQVPRNPALPRISSRIDRVGTSAPVTRSRNGRR